MYVKFIDTQYLCNISISQDSSNVDAEYLQASW